jgi:putative ABC transport system permease protein
MKTRDVIRELAISNLKRKRSRTIGLTAIIAVLAFVLFGGIIIGQSLQNGLSNLQQRFGADLIIVPEENSKDMEDILLKAEQSYFYMNSSIYDEIESLASFDRISAISSQFYLVSLSDSPCCAFPVEMIGFDEATDFVIGPWLEKNYHGTLNYGDIIIGGEVSGNIGETITFFGKEYKIAARLDATGTSLDNSVYMNMDTIVDMYTAAQEKGYSYVEYPEDMISSILIKVDRAEDIEIVARDISQHIEGVKVINTQSILTTIADSLGDFKVFYIITVAMLIILAFVTISSIFAVVINERKKEFAILRTIGLTKLKLQKVFVVETLIISVAGAVAGIVIAGNIIFPFNVAITDNLSLPFFSPGIIYVILLALVIAVLCSLLGPLAGLLLIHGQVKNDVYLNIRDGE